MRRRVITAVCAIALLGVIFGIKWIKGARGKSPEAEWVSFRDAFWTAHRELMVASETTPDQWEKFLQHYADAEDYAARALAMAKAHPGSETAEQELWWIIAYCTEAPSCKEALEIYSRDYPDSFPIKCRGIYRNEAWEDHCFQAITQRSPNRQMRAQAMLARARFRQTIMHDNATAENLYEQVVAEFADIKLSKESAATLGELARDDLMNLRSPDPAWKPLRAGEKVPRFEAITTDRIAVHLPDNYKGKVVLIDFWATWCVPCVAEIPNVVDAYEKYHARGLEVLGVSLDQENVGELVASFTRKHNMPWPEIYDGKYLDTPLARRFGITGNPQPTGIPHAFIVDGDTGLIIAEGQDARGPKLAVAIEAALAKRQSAPYE
jgi:peroxiredoxin